MGIMTAETITVSDRGMNDLGLFYQTSVAWFAERFAGGKQQLGVIAGVRSVAGGTPFVSYNRMDTTHSLARIVVTAGTKGAIGGDEEFTIFTQVGIMTTGAAIFQGGMDHLLPLTPAVMALLAEGGAVGGEFESPLLAGVGNTAAFVAGRTISSGHRVVQLHPFCRSHRRVTFGGHATLGGGKGECRHDKKADPE